MENAEKIRYYEALYRISSNPDYKIVRDCMLLDLADMQKALVTETDYKKIGWIQGAAQYLQNRLTQIREAGNNLEALKNNQDGG